MAYQFLDICKNCKWWDANYTWERFGYCRHPRWSGEEPEKHTLPYHYFWTLAHDDEGKVSVLTNKDFSCIGFESKENRK